MFSLFSAKRLEHSVQQQKSVAALARAIALRMGLAGNLVETAYAGARVHDIGELCLPATMLMKQSRLTRSETAAVQNHCRIGYDLVRDIACPWPIGEVILQHHERLDGSGYPAGLKGSQIGLPARIVAVADVFCAITRDRPHKAARSVEIALRELRRGRAVLYDADVVDTCIMLFEEDRIAWPQAEMPNSPQFAEWASQL